MERNDPCSHWEEGRKKSTSCETLTHTAKTWWELPLLQVFKRRIDEFMCRA